MYCTVQSQGDGEMDYLEILKAAWEVLKNELANGGFDPRTEADVKCFLYSCLREKLGTARNIHAEFNHSKRKRTDLVVNRVFIEINFIIKSGAYALGKRTDAAWDSREKNANEEIARLAELKKPRPEIVPVLAIVAGDYEENDNPRFYNRIKESCEKHSIVLLTAWKRHVRGRDNVAALDAETEGEKEK